MADTTALPLIIEEDVQLEVMVQVCQPSTQSARQEVCDSKIRPGCILRPCLKTQGAEGRQSLSSGTQLPSLPLVWKTEASRLDFNLGVF